MAQFLTTEQRDSLVELYIGYFNRAPEAAGLSYWSETLLDLLNQGKTEDEALSFIADQFYDAGVQYGVYSAAMPAEDFIKTAYQNVLGRDLDAEPADDRNEALNYWGQQLEDGLSKGQFIRELIQAAKAYKNDPDWGWVATYLEARTAVGVEFAKPENSAGLTAQAAIAAGQAALAVVEPRMTVEQAIAAFEGSGGGVPGQTFTLTTAAGESVVGTAGNDEFRGVVDAPAPAGTPTVNAGDVINGGAGTDTLNLVIAGAAVAPVAGFSTTAVETVNLNVGSNAANAGYLTSALYAGATSLNQIDQVNGAGAANFGNVTVGAGVTAGFQSTGNAATAGNVGGAGITITGATNTQTSLSAKVDGVLGGEVLNFVAAAGATEQITTINVSGSTVAATAATNTLTVADDTGTTTLNLALTSATRVIITDIDNSLETIDMSGSTGNVRINTSIDTLTSVDTVKGGSGNNTVFLDAGNATAANVKIDLGAGNDTIGLTVTTGTVDAKTEITLGAGADTVAVGLTAAGALGNLTNIVDTNTDGTISATELVANLVTIADFNTSEDVLNLDTDALEGTALTDPQLQAIGGAASLAAAVAAAAGNIGVGTAGVFSYGGNAYVFVNNAGAGTVDAGDGLIKLTGVADSTLFDTNQGGNLVI